MGKVEILSAGLAWLYRPPEFTQGIQFMKKRFLFCLLPLAALMGQTPAPTANPSRPAASKPAAGKPAPTAQQPAAGAAEGSAPSAAEVPDTAVVLTVGNEKITKAEYERFIASLPERAQAEAKGPNKRKIAEQIAEIKALAQEAEKRKLHETEKVQQQLAFQRQNVLASLLVQELLANSTPSEADLRKAYEEKKPEFETVTARHILVRMQGSPVPLRDKEQKDLTDAEAQAKAKEIQQKIQAGADFSELAKAESDDTASGANGGVLGTFSRGQMVPEFEQAAFALEVGKVSDPVKTNFGYHLILVDEHKTKSFEEVKPELEKRLKPEMTRKAVDHIQKSAPIVINESYFGKP
jgi:Parvulin-like peptidyl-prolyl isomerase